MQDLESIDSAQPPHIKQYPVAEDREQLFKQEHEIKIHIYYLIMLSSAR